MEFPRHHQEILDLAFPCERGYSFQVLSTKKGFATQQYGWTSSWSTVVMLHYNGDLLATAMSEHDGDSTSSNDRASYKVLRLLQPPHRDLISPRLLERMDHQGLPPNIIWQAKERALKMRQILGHKPPKQLKRIHPADEDLQNIHLTVDIWNHSTKIYTVWTHGAAGVWCTTHHDAIRVAYTAYINHYYHKYTNFFNAIKHYPTFSWDGTSGTVTADVNADIMPLLTAQMDTALHSAAGRNAVYTGISVIHHKAVPKYITLAFHDGARLTGQMILPAVFAPSLYDLMTSSDFIKIHFGEWEWIQWLETSSTEEDADYCNKTIYNVREEGSTSGTYVHKTIQTMVANVLGEYVETDSTILQRIAQIPTQSNPAIWPSNYRQQALLNAVACAACGAAFGLECEIVKEANDLGDEAASDSDDDSD